MDFMETIKWLGIGVVAIALVFFGLSFYGAARWVKQTKELLDLLNTARQAHVSTSYNEQELKGLPEPVQRYFRAVLKDGQPIIAEANVDHTGTFNMGESADRWKPFTSQQRVVTRRPGFVWDGRVVMMPGLPVNVHDAYVAGTGILHPAILGLFSLTDLRGEGEIAKGELMRFFAETAWYPTALLPSQGARWEAVDERSARCTLVDDKISLTLLFLFDDRSLIESVRAEARGRTVNKTIVMTPWEGRWSNYQRRDGMQVPMTGEVAWLTPEGRKPYWRGTITKLQYEFAR
jgi:hypothetical protein